MASHTREPLARYLEAATFLSPHASATERGDSPPHSFTTSPIPSRNKEVISLASNQEEAILRAIRNNDAAAALTAYAAYADSMARAGQVAKPASYFGIGR